MNSRYLSVVKVTEAGRLAKYLEFDSFQAAQEHAATYNGVVYDNYYRIPIHRILVKNDEIVDSAPEPTLEELKKKALFAEMDKKKKAEIKDLLDKGTTPEAVAYRARRDQ